MNKQQLFKTIASYLKKHGAKKVAIFGSYARDEETSKSDVDVLVEFKARISLLKIVGIQDDLKDITGKKIDLQTEKSISKYIREQVKKEMKVIM